MFGENIIHRFWYVNDKEKVAIEEFYKKHLHEETWGKGGAIPETPYHIEIKPNSIGYSVIVVCDVCAKKRRLRKKNLWIKDVTDWDSI